MKKSALMASIGMATLLSACSTLGSNTSDNQNFGSYEMGRSIPERISDESIELTARKNLSRIDGISENTVRIAIDSFRREVLVTGEVPSESIKANIESMLKSMKDVTAVYNYLTVAETPKSQSHTVHESYLKSKINARLIANKGIKSSQYKVVVRDRTAYVMGYMTQAQQGYILEAVQNTAGMASAVTLTTLVSDDVAAQAPVSAPTTTTATATADTTASDGVIYGGVVNGVVDTQSNDTYALQEIYLPNASTNAPTNAAPIYTPTGTGTSGYVELYQGTSTP